MALTLRKTFLGQTSTVFSKKSYIEDMVNDTIKVKLFNTLGVNRIIYFRLIEYFLVYGIADACSEKTVASIYMRLKNKKHKGYKKLSVREIEAMGINLVEFIDYLGLNGANEITNNCDLLEEV